MHFPTYPFGCVYFASSACLFICLKFVKYFLLCNVQSLMFLLWEVSPFLLLVLSQVSQGATPHPQSLVSANNWSQTVFEHLEIVRFLLSHKREGIERLECLYTADRDTKLYSYSEQQLALSLRIKHKFSIQLSNSSLGNLNQRN